MLKNLQQAVLSQDVEAVREILTKNSNLQNMSGDWSFLPLWNALSSDNEKIAKLLIELGPNVNLEALLKTAIMERSVKCVEFLSKNGAKVEPKWLGESAADILQEHNISDRKEMLQLLFECGLDARFRNEKGETLLDIFIDNVEKEDHDAGEIATILADAGVPFDEFLRVPSN